MNIISLLVLCLAPACQEGWRDTHRVHLRNGNFIDGRLEQVGDKEILFRWSPAAVLRIRLIDIRGDGIEEIKIRTLHSEPKKVPVRDVVPPPTDVRIPTVEKPPVRDPNRPQSEIDKLFTRLLNQPDMTFELLAKEVSALGVEGARAMIAELPQMDQQKTNLALVSLDQMKELPIDRDLRGLLDSKRPDIRAGVCSILGNRGSTDSLRSILALLRDPAPQVRTAALMAVPAFNDTSVIAAVGDLAIDPDPQVRGRAMRCAEELSARAKADNDLVHQWLSLLGRGTPDSMAEVAGAIGRLAQRAGEGFPADDVRNRLGGMLAHRDPLARGAAAYALSSVQPPEPSADAILAAFDSEREPKVIVHMCDALGRLRMQKSIEPLIEKLREDSKEIRPAAQRALEKITGNIELGSNYEKWMEWFDKSKAQNP